MFTTFTAAINGKATAAVGEQNSPDSLSPAQQSEASTTSSKLSTRKPVRGRPASGASAPRRTARVLFHTDRYLVR